MKRIYSLPSSEQRKFFSALGKRQNPFAVLEKRRKPIDIKKVDVDTVLKWFEQNKDVRVFRNWNMKNDSDKNVFNAIFTDRSRPIRFIYYDQVNGIRKSAQQSFYLRYGISLEKSKRKLSQFGEHVVVRLKKAGVNAVCNDYMSGRILIQP